MAAPTRRAWPLVRPIVVLLAGVAACGPSVSASCEPAPGEIVFGSELAPGNTMVLDCSDTFSKEGDFALLGVFPRNVTGAVHIETAKNGAQPQYGAGRYTFSEPGDYYWAIWDLDDFPGPGDYVIYIKLGAEILATGEFKLTPE